MADQNSTTSHMRSILREPTLHFVLLAAILFATNAAVRARDRGHVIQIDRGKIAANIMQIEASIGAPLSSEDQQRVEDAYVEQQVLVREAQALGLDEDYQVHDMLAQKMLHVLSADVIQPTDAELEAYYEANLGRYVPEAAVTVDELVVGTQGPLPATVRDQLRDGVAPGQLVSDLPIGRDVLMKVTLGDLTRIFGEEMAKRAFAAREGQWVGPHHTVRGQHWLRVTERMASVPPALDAVREQVRLDWISDHEQARLEQRVNELRGKYVIEFTGEGKTP
ncbi:MAG: peptidyl-prolyl cis-trans isomerase [Gemmatimonadetes bacterium]|nr:peptidyl-prolyl cis-trans isomerase [Gemmatimonadota bacterium]